MTLTTDPRPAPTTTEVRPPTGDGTTFTELAGAAPLPFTRLVRLELRKAVDTRTGRWLIGAIVLLTAVVIGLTMWFSRDEGASLGLLMAATTTPQGMLLPVLGILTACSEWSQRTALITFTQEPRRLRVMAAKAVAAVLIGLVVLVATVVLAALGHVLSMALADGPVDLTLTAAGLVNTTLLQVVNVLQGVAFGALLLNVPVAIVAFFLLPTVMPLVSATVGFVERHQVWLDPSAGAAPLLGESWLTGEQWQHVASIVALWLVLPLVAGFVRVARKEVK